MSEKGLDLKSYILSVVDEEIDRFNAVLKFNEEELTVYKELLDHFKGTNNSSQSTQRKGEALENIVSYIMEKSVVFEVIQNVRTSSNEIDLLIRLNERGRFFKAQGLLTFEDKLIAECKNYEGRVSVTWVGKFSSLMNYTRNNLGIMFSYHGLTGSGWKDAEGLTKKLYLGESAKIIDFNISDFELLASGESFIKIINDKIFALESDTSYKGFILEHPNESAFKI
ncbi:restriction endonuclease [Bhargavaea beijingensis]|uniref:restriction endonuclease n=1 Tax=Bhargavaea beijingensis TaxID=426756 RepID=UPI00222453BE|nr:restriction endonuclease [Bhargavaea beijingensis]MCW1927363.1 acetylglutamate semialdehyde dehydrogenase [Bhargavaea beijingensis]